MTEKVITPHLTTALKGPLQLLEKHILTNQTKIETWFRNMWHKFPPPVYGSVDLRNAGFKLAPVDMNLFPAGFNNLNPDFLPLCIQAVQQTIEKCDKGATKILLVSENHTRNTFYLENLATLHNIILKAGFEVRIGSLALDLHEPRVIELPSKQLITIEPIKRHKNRIILSDFDPCMIWLNNDLSGAFPSLLKDIEQPFYPPAQLGWYNRLKSNHFACYERITDTFSKLIDIDPWLITPLFNQCSNIDFQNREGNICLIRNAEKLFYQIENKYKSYDIDQKPFIIVKADSGSYGMGIMTIQDPAELMELNRKQRTKMATTKGRQPVHQVILQEGIYTFETFGQNEHVAEPVVYMIGQHVVGGFYRVHQNRGKMENLNAPGMHFEPLAFAKCCNNPDNHYHPDTCANRFYAYGVIARLSMLAAAQEQKAFR